MMAIDTSDRVYEDGNDLLKDRADCLRVDAMKKDGSWHVVLVLDGGYAVKKGIPNFCADDAVEYFRHHIAVMLNATQPDKNHHNWVNAKNG
jgi:hypothetical protein